MYLIVENLRHYLESDEIRQASEGSIAPLFLGRRFAENGDMNRIFNSGGSGYTLKKEALKVLVESFPSCFPTLFSSAEDVYVASCLRDQGIFPYDTKDSKGGERYMPFTPEGHMLEPGGWYAEYCIDCKVGIDHVASRPIAFHYVHPDLMKRMHAILYGYCNTQDVKIATTTGTLLSSTRSVPEGIAVGMDQNHPYFFKPREGERDFFAIGKQIGTDKVLGPDNLAPCLRRGEACVSPGCSRNECRPWGHFYHNLHVYQQRLGYYSRDDSQPFQFLEVGFYQGRGYDTFRTFMPHAEVHSIEISCVEDGPVSETKWRHENAAKANPRYYQYLEEDRLHCGDATNVTFLDLVWRNAMRRPHAPPLRVVVDDGSHHAEHMAQTVFFWFPRIEPRGLLIVEDIQPTSSSDAFRTQFLPQMMHDLHFCGDPSEETDEPCFPTLFSLLASIHCEMHICIFERNDREAEDLNLREATVPNGALDLAQCATVSEQDVDVDPVHSHHVTDLRQRQMKNYRDGKALIINVHITHHAGTTFCFEMNRWGPVPSFACMGGNNWNQTALPPHGDRPWANNATEERTDLLRSHFHMISWEFGEFPKPPLSETKWESEHLVSVYITRNPLDRLLSGDADANRQFGTLEDRTLDQWWAYSNSTHTDNFALNRLTGGSCVDGDQTPESCLEKGKGLLSRFTVVLDQECLSESIMAFARLMDKSPPDQKTSRTYKKVPKSAVSNARDRIKSDEVYEYLVKRNKRDIAMYEWSKGISLVRCDELVDGEADADHGSSDEDNIEGNR